MGTSASYPTPTGGDWTKLKRRVTRFVSSGGESGGASTPAGILSAFVGALGGAAEAARSSSSAVAAIGDLASFATAVEARGLPQALTEFGLADLVGAPVEAILARLLDLFAATNDDLEQSAARDALAHVEDELLRRCETAEQLETEFQQLVDLERLSDLLAAFITAYIFARLLTAIKKQIRDGASPAQARALEKELKEFISECVRNELQNVDIATFDWSDPGGTSAIQRVLNDAYEVLEAHDK